MARVLLNISGIKRSEEYQAAYARFSDRGPEPSSIRGYPGFSDNPEKGKKKNEEDGDKARIDDLPHGDAGV
ncbi:MAG: hypothetical protein JXR72_00250 [Proteobacteria bacterium]|nr:hypothetical protein [Pseudomonadota bacterium]